MENVCRESQTIPFNDVYHNQKIETKSLNHTKIGTQKRLKNGIIEQTRRTGCPST